MTIRENIFFVNPPSFLSWDSHLLYSIVCTLLFFESGKPTVCYRTLPVFPQFNQRAARFQSRNLDRAERWPRSQGTITNHRFLGDNAYWYRNNNWLVVWNIFYFSICLEYSSQLTNSYFSEGWPNHQPDKDHRIFYGQNQFRECHHHTFFGSTFSTFSIGSYEGWVVDLLILGTFIVVFKGWD